MSSPLSPPRAATRGAAVARLALCVLLCFLPALGGVFFAPGEWYAGLAKPALNPPAWVFGPVWTALYASMGLALSLAPAPARAARAWPALALFGLQLLLNALWSWLFFGLHRPDLALLDIAALWLAILACAVAFWRLRPLAGALLLPYLAWVGFAAYLNLELWRLNG